jgi:hypothetical protein
MKAIEILSESKKIDEAPASMLGQIAKRAGAGVLGAMGLNTWAGQINDKADVGMFANRYYKEFTNYLKGRNRDPESATYGDLKSFMSKNKIPTGNVPSDPSGVASKSMVNSILAQTAQEVLSGKSSGSSVDTTAATKAQKTTTTQPNTTVQQPTTSQQSTNTVKPVTSKTDIDSMIQKISQMNAKDLAKVEKAVQSAKGLVPAADNRTPAEIRAAKQKTAAANAQAQMKPVSKVTSTPGDVRATKQAAAAKTAQDQMAANPSVKASNTSAPQRRRRNRRPKVTPAV